MIELDTKLSLDEILESHNLAEKLKEEDLEKISEYCAGGFQADLQSRLQWEEKTKEALKLALQVEEQKSFPWPGCSNVKFPLLTISSLQFHSRAYPALVQAPEVVRCQVWEDDPNGEYNQMASLVGQHMSWQVLEEDKCWEAEHDKALLALPILGCLFKKSYFDSACGHNKSEMVLPSDLVVDYWAKSVEDAARVSHIQYLNKNDYKEKEVLGLWLEQGELTSRTEPVELGTLAQVRAETQGENSGEGEYDSVYITIEQLCWLDLDGDGYQEPYVVTFRHDNGKVLRIKARFFESGVVRSDDGKEVAKIVPERIYTKYTFIPSPDGGFYDLGFGALLGPINKSIDAAINQLLDAGTMSNAGGGFLGKGIRLKGGAISFVPNEWKKVDVTGDDISKSIYPLPVKEPSNVLLQLLSILIQYGERIAGATDVLAGDNPGQNTKTGTMQAMVEQGLQIFNGIYKRVFRSMKDEFQVLFRLNHLYLDNMQTFSSLKDGQKKQILRQAYDLPASCISPAADPNYMSEQQRAQQAQMLRQASVEKAGLYNQLEVERYFLECLKIPGIDKFLVKELPPPQPSEKVQIAQLQAQGKQAELQQKAQQANQDFRTKLVDLANQAEMNQAKIIQAEAQALLFTEQAQAKGLDAQIAMINSEIGAAKVHHEALLETIHKLESLHIDHKKIDMQEKVGMAKKQGGGE